MEGSCLFCHEVTRESRHGVIRKYCSESCRQKHGRLIGRFAAYNQKTKTHYQKTFEIFMAYLEHKPEAVVRLRNLLVDGVKQSR